MDNKEETDNKETEMWVRNVIEEWLHALGDSLEEAGDDKQAYATAILGGAAFWAVTALKYSEMPNFITGEFSFGEPGTPETRPVAVTVSWVDGKSPAGKIAELEEEVESLKRRLAQTEQFVAFSGQ